MKHDIREPDKIKRHTYTFNRAELEYILYKHIESINNKVPGGKLSLSGLQYQTYQKEELILYIDEPIESP